MDVTANIHTLVNIIVAFLWSLLLKIRGEKLQDGFRVWLPDKPKLSWGINAAYSLLTSALCQSTHCPAPLLDVAPEAVFQWQIFHQEFAD